MTIPLQITIALLIGLLVATVLSWFDAPLWAQLLGFLLAWNQVSINASFMIVLSRLAQQRRQLSAEEAPGA